MNKQVHIFAEYCFFTENKGEAENYLQMWKKNLLMKLSRETYSAMIVDEEYITTPSYFYDPLFAYSKLALKLAVELEFRFETDNCFKNYYGMCPMPEKKKGIQDAIKISESKLKKSEHSKNPKTARRARLGETLKKMHK